MRMTEINRFAPTYSKAKAELAKLNYVEDEKGGWQRRDRREAAARIARSKRTLGVDALASDVLDQLGEPTRRSRIATAAGVSHIWTYRTPAETVVFVLTGPEETLRVSKLHRSN
jgi:hypothetical protein